MLQFLQSAIANAPYIALLAFGFGFVIFWHELGHFLAAKWAGVRVEQFAVGFAHAVVSWRKGIGVRFGNTQAEYRRRVLKHLGLDENLSIDDPTHPSERVINETGDKLGLGETEYRLNWLPLGGYVKMMGQDDLNPNSEVDDPKAYNRQSIGKRMVIVSAGVVMNIILAAIGFIVLFSIGFNVPPSRVGTVLIGSPFQLAGGQVGDRIISIDGNLVYDDWNKTQLVAALRERDKVIPIVVERLGPDGKPTQVTLQVRPVKADNGGVTFVSLGVGAYADLAGPKVDSKAPTDEEYAQATKQFERNSLLIRPGDEITHVNGIAVKPEDYAVFDAQVQRGEDVTLTIVRAGQTQNVSFTPTFGSSFGADAFSLLGMYPRQVISQISKDSPLYDKAQPGDVLLALAVDGNQDVTPTPSFNALRTTVEAAAKADQKLRVTLLRDGKAMDFAGLEPIRIRRDRYGLSVGLRADQSSVVVAEVTPGSVAAKAAIPARATIQKVGDQPVTSWNAFHRTLRDRVAGAADTAEVPITFKADGGEEKTTTLALTAADIAAIRNVRYDADIRLRATVGTRIASGVGEAAKLGLIETRDFILQFYVTLKRMVTRDVGVDNLMGPVGIFQTGTVIAQRGNDWLLWFLSMISANLAVVNFLPIPIVDGGLFTFLLIEKIKGRPASPRTQAIAQRIGIVLLLSIFVFVTFQDVMNLPFRMGR